MIRFNNDYNRGAHPEILKALAETNDNSYEGYGKDVLCDKAKELIRDVAGHPDADIHFLVGGTQVNYIMLEACMTRPYYSVICADTGHVNVHEAGAIENTGHKLQTLKSVDGKITAEQIAGEAEYYRSSPLKEHITEPHVVYISYPTEFGTTYTLEELEAIREVCDEYGLYLYIDGARLGYGLASSASDASIADITRIADAYTIGGTKCGLLFGEALVIRNEALKEGIRSYMKLNGALLAKGWLLGLQFIAMFRDGLYFDICDRAVRLAEQLKRAFARNGYEEYIESDTNQLFYIMDNSKIDELSRKFFFEVMDPYDENRRIVRFCTSWSCTQGEIDELIAAL